jgi:hypothetical protein
MPRQARKLSGTGVYHVMLRGINRQDIFEDDEDYRQMTGCLRSLTERYDDMITRTVPMILRKRIKACDAKPDEAGAVDTFDAIDTIF